MELLDRYLQAVKKYLPARRQDDIIAELRANMESQIEDKESELGRPLTQGEMEDLLRKMGSPVIVASRYQPQQYLIGPALFPLVSLCAARRGLVDPDHLLHRHRGCSPFMASPRSQRHRRFASAYAELFSSTLPRG